MGSSASSPLIPLFRAVEAVAEDNADISLDWPSVDIIANRSSLRKLLRWIRHSDARPADDNLPVRHSTARGMPRKLRDEHNYTRAGVRVVVRPLPDRAIRAPLLICVVVYTDAHLSSRGM